MIRSPAWHKELERRTARLERLQKYIAVRRCDENSEAAIRSLEEVQRELVDELAAMWQRPAEVLILEYTRCKVY